jgi:hypothetical protein
MFLDEELYQIGHKFNGSNDIELIKEMIQVCLDRSRIDLKGQNDAALIPVLKRINTSWNIAIDKLTKENKNITLKDGFLLFLLHSDRFECLHNIVKQII